jgi:hypothetical protein
MRSVLLAFMLCVTSTAALARNGETGILIALPNFQSEALQERGIVKVCDREWQTIREVLAAGYETQVLLKGVGTFQAAEDQDGMVHLVKEGADEIVLAPNDSESEAVCD